MNESTRATFEQWRANESMAEAMVPLLGRLYRDRDVVLKIYGQTITGESVVRILKAHRFARQVTGSELSPASTLPLLEAMATMDLDSARVDIGKLASDWTANATDMTAADFLADRLSTIMTGAGRMLTQPTDVVLYGFGRIGRLLARILISKTGSGEKLRLRAIVLRPGKPDDLAKRASLLRRDSIHGPFAGTITIDQDKDQIIANGNPIQLIYAKSPSDVDYAAHGISNAIVVDNTGMWRDRDGLSEHLKSEGVSKVLLTAPGKGDVKNIIFGVNDGDIDAEDNVLSAASCTTNAIVPALKAINDRFGIVNGHLETVHAYTNDQNLTDNYHSKERRGRSAPLNMVITTTGAATAVAKALPELDGKLTGNAIRVPTPNVSLAILNLNLETDVNKEQVNTFLRKTSLDGPLRNQIDYTSSTEIVSSDLVGTDRASVVDGSATITDGKRCILYVWYDNEAGYSYQVIRVVQSLAGLRYPSVPAQP